MSKQPEQAVYDRQGFGRSLELTEMSDLSQVVPELPPARGDLIIRKQFPSAFFGTHLASDLAMKGIRTLLISGATTSACVRASAVEIMKLHEVEALAALDGNRQ